MAKQLAFYIDTSACGNCKTCQVACKDKNNLPVGVLWRRVHQYGGGGWKRQHGYFLPEKVFSYGVTVSCMHCAKPACMKACEFGAITKRADGIVLVDQKKCTGCGECKTACPYGAPQFYGADKLMSKCNFCEDLLAKGENPACVDACPMRALGFGELSELQAKFGNLQAIEPLPKATITQPSVVITPHKDAQISGEGNGRILDLVQSL